MALTVERRGAHDEDVDDATSDNTSPEPSSTISFLGIEFPSWMVIAVGILAALGAVFGIALTFGSGEKTLTPDEVVVASEPDADRPQPVEVAPAPTAPEPATPAPQPTATAAPTATPVPATPNETSSPTAVALAAGTYVISEKSALAALQVNVLDPESATGSLTVDADGTVHGTFTLVYWDTYGNPDDDLVARATATVKLMPGRLAEAETGLTFETVVDENILVEAPDRTFTQPVQLPVSGRVDPDTGLLELSLAGDSTFVEFHRS